MKIVDAQRSDAVAITRIWNDMIRDSLDTFTTRQKAIAEVEDLIAARAGAFFVARSEVVSGFVTFGPFRSGPGYGATVEHSIVLSDDARGRGIGRALMDRALCAATREGLHIMVAGISGANAGGVAFHEAMGFDHVGLMPAVGRKWGQWLDLILMQKILSAP